MGAGGGEGSPARQRDDKIPRVYNLRIDNNHKKTQPQMQAGRAEENGKTINQTTLKLSSVLFQKPRS